MRKCPKCGKDFDENYEFCDNCGVRLIKSTGYIPSQINQGAFNKIEKTVFFRITRVLTWIFIILSIFGFIGAIFLFITDISSLIRKDTSVSVRDVKTAIESSKPGRPSSEGETPILPIDPEQLAKLDKEIYEIILLLPKEIQDKMGIEKLRGAIKDWISRYKSVKEKLKILREARNILMKFDGPDRATALPLFFKIKVQKENEIEMKRADATIQMAKIGGTFFAAIMTIAVFSLILVLMAIERNTRKE
jgi:hypothetical protein